MTITEYPVHAPPGPGTDVLDPYVIDEVGGPPSGPSPIRPQQEPPEPGRVGRARGTR